MHPQSNQIIADNNAISIMTLLKNHTSTAHKQLENTRFLKRLFAVDYTTAEYTQLLSYFYSYFAAVEPLLFADLPTESHTYLQHRTKTHLLQQDLISLGVNPDALVVSHILPPLTTFAQKMGVLYVLEGSLLGGRIIGQHLKSHFGEHVLLPLNFYSCYGADLHLQWQNFSIFMGQSFNHQGDAVINEVIESATQTFVSLQQWIEYCSAQDEGN
jgi:heme oxygenase